MRKIVLAAAVALALSADLAFAADLGIARKSPSLMPPSPFDIAFGGAVMTDYNFRGISQSDRGFSVGAYLEPRFKITPNVELYVGIAGYSTKLPTSPTGEFDLYGGIRPTLGPLSFDLGFIYYWYPKERQVFLDPVTGGAVLLPTPVIWTLSDTDYWEVYGKASFGWNDIVSVGSSVYHSPSWLNTGADGTFASGTLKIVLPSGVLPGPTGAYISAELGHYWLGTTNAILGSIDLPDYTTWNAGLGLTFKVFTLDLRYYDTDLTKSQCFALTGDLSGLPGGGGMLGQSKWCGAAFIAKLAFDMTLDHLK